MCIHEFDALGVIAYPLCRLQEGNNWEHPTFHWEIWLLPDRDVSQENENKDRI